MTSKFNQYIHNNGCKLLAIAQEDCSTSRPSFAESLLGHVHVHILDRCGIQEVSDLSSVWAVEIAHSLEGLFDVFRSPLVDLGCFALTDSRSGDVLCDVPCNPVVQKGHKPDLQQQYWFKRVSLQSLVCLIALKK